MNGRLASDVVEAFGLGDVRVRIASRECGGLTRHVASFAIDTASLESAPTFQIDELEDLVAAAQAAIAIVDLLDGRSGPADLARRLNRLDRELVA
jgi:hypothetical protein